MPAAEYLDTELAEAIYYGGDGKVAIQEVSQHRWYTKMLVVFAGRDGKLFGFYYLEPATELQEDQERFESDPVRVFPVRAFEVTHTRYERVEDDER